MAKHFKNRVSVLTILALHASVAGMVGQNCTVDWNDVHQRIDGFGASSAFSQRTWSSTTADILFSTNDVGGNICIGLSLLRNRITTNVTATASEISLMQQVGARGAKVWSTPWSPPLGFKSNKNLVGGNYLSASNQAYASLLANYVVTLQNQGIPIYALSIQNEPDANVTYDSCHWTAQQFHDFVPYLYTNLLASNVISTKIMLPESESWTGTNLYTTTMNDVNVAPMVGILANHNYVANNVVGDMTTPAVLPSYGKTLWETEVAHLGGTYDPSITNAMYWATRVHLFLTVAQVNAWHYWWLITGNGDNSGLMGHDTTGDLPTKRMYIVGQFSRFVRPNYYRIGAVSSDSALVSAYKDPLTGSFAIVAINTNLNTDLNETFSLANIAVNGSVSPWITSSGFSLSNQPPVSITGSTFSYTLPAMSVVTFVGNTNAPANTPPTLAHIPDQTVGAGMTLVVTNQATDSDLPPQTLTFGLVSAGPANSTLDAASGVFTWRPLVSQADTTNLITVKVTDNGIPNLSATNSFAVVVNPLAQPNVSSISLGGGQVSLLINGPAGPDYTLLTSTNLTSWQILYTTNSPVLPLTLVDTNVIDSARFYRIQLGP